MGLLFWRKKRTTRKLEVGTEPAVPGREVSLALVSAKVAPGYRLGDCKAKVVVNGKKDVDNTYHSGEGLTSSEVSATLDIAEQAVLADADTAGPTADLPFTVRLPIWAPPTAIGDLRFLTYSSRPGVELSPLAYGGTARFDIDALPVHHTLRAAVDAMGWTFVRSQLWHRSGRKGPSVVQVLTFRPGNSVELAGAKVVHVQVVAIATSPNSARVEIGVHARKFPHGLFRIAKVDDVAIGDDSRTWANAVKVRLAEELATAKIPGGGLIDDNAIAGAITTLLG
ncbi:hypothetical protein JGU71_04845 [Antrihabitans sp. YC3-6]|uniref:Uncharacterized protein n=1 Tax=Antrihabitans stalagmiti TaxID=2799499 RepID=A0A934U1C8_9NOCA|nr:hypothetical protein [Antrihabitans stalagmiti]MBJ8338205.1 hypothetical protein [Antrihabitans stalagmiti]